MYLSLCVCVCKSARARTASSLAFQKWWMNAVKKGEKRLLIIFYIFPRMHRTTMKMFLSFSRRLKSQKNKEKKKYAQKTHAKRHKRDGDDNDDDDDDDDAPCTRKPGDKTRIGTDRSILASTTLRSMVSQLDRARQGSTKTFIVSLLPSDTSETALETLKRYNVLSAPVTIQNLEGLNREDERATCVGFFSVSDVIDPLVEAFEDEKNWRECKTRSTCCKR